MSYRAETIASGEYYHVMNRGVEKRDVFLDDQDRWRFLEMFAYYLRSNPPTSFSQLKIIQLRKLETHNWGDQLVEVVAFCLMPNHFHLLLKPNVEGGLALFMARLSNAYTRAFNTRYKRIGPLFQGAYKAVLIETNSQLLHVCRYIHLNPFVARLTRDSTSFLWSSHRIYLDVIEPFFPLDLEAVRGQFSSIDDFAAFVNDHADYARTIAAHKKLLLEEE